jgi:hypothetical protein
LFCFNFIYYYLDLTLCLKCYVKKTLKPENNHTLDHQVSSFTPPPPPSSSYSSLSGFSLYHSNDKKYPPLIYAENIDLYFDEYSNNYICRYLFIILFYFYYQNCNLY